MLARAKSLGQLSFTSTSEGVPGVGVIAIVVDGQKVPVGADPADTRADELGSESGVPEPEWLTIAILVITRSVAPQ